MAKINISDVTSGFASVSALNEAFQDLEDELNQKVLYRDNPTGEPNQMESDLDMNGHRILNAIASSGEGFIWEGVWLTGTSYQVNSLIQEAGTTYICVVSHTSGTFSTDLTSGYWEILAARGSSGAGTGDMLAANNLSELTATAATARSNISAAKSGANSDITSLTGLTEATFKSTYNMEAGVDYIGFVAPGTSGNVLVSNGSSWISSALGGNIKQIITANNTTYAGYSTNIPPDNSIPLISEGTEVLTASITPTSATSKIIAIAHTPIYSGNNGQWFTATIFQETTCVQAEQIQPGGYGYMPFNLLATATSGSTSPQTWSVRCGGNGSVAWYINGITSGRQYGGAASLQLILLEIE